MHQVRLTGFHAKVLHVTHKNNPKSNLKPKPYSKLLTLEAVAAPVPIPETRAQCEYFRV